MSTPTPTPPKTKVSPIALLVVVAIVIFAVIFIVQPLQKAKTSPPDQNTSGQVAQSSDGSTPPPTPGIPQPADPAVYARDLQGKLASNIDGKYYKLIVTISALPPDPSAPDKALDRDKIPGDVDQKLRDAGITMRQEVLLDNPAIAKNTVADMARKYDQWKTPSEAAAKTMNCKLFMSYQVNAPIAGGETVYANYLPESQVLGYINGLFTDLAENAGNTDKLTNIVLKQKLANQGVNQSGGT